MIILRTTLKRKSKVESYDDSNTFKIKNQKLLMIIKSGVMPEKFLSIMKQKMKKPEEAATSIET